MLRSRTNAGSKVSYALDAPSSAPTVPRNARRRQKPGNRQSTGLSTICGIITIVLALTTIGLVFYHFAHKSNDHIVKTMHLRKSAFRGSGIESPQQDDIVPEDSIYNLMYPSMKHRGELVSLANFAGRVAIVINVASEWGKTGLTYGHIKAMLKKYSSKTFDEDISTSGQAGAKSRGRYHDKNLVILAFPTNDFKQEQGGNEDIEIKVKELLGDEYDNPNFMLFHKSKLEHNPIYKSLRNHMPEHEVKHNFFKYLIGKDGVPVAFYTKKQTLFDMEDAILDELETDSSVGENLRLRDGDTIFFDKE